jgi:hypothetical protein
MAGKGMNKLMRAVLAGLALSLLLAGSALAECSTCGGGCGDGKCAEGAHQHYDSKCGCKSRNYCRCKSKCRSCWGGCGKWSNADACCPEQADVVRVCVHEDECACGGHGHPYEQSYNGSSMLCDTGCSAYIPCKRIGIVCETKCTARENGCSCNKCQVDYCVTQECHEVERPRVVPWWFSGGKGNIYMESDATGPAMVDDWAGGMKIAGAAGSPEKKADAPAEEAPAEADAPETQNG